MDNKRHSITQIFDTDVIIEIPFFQRSYVWDETEWKRFLSGMDEVSRTKKSYFFGAILLKKTSESGKQLTIIDGQQRITTLLVLLKILSLKAPEMKYRFEIHFMLDDSGYPKSPKLRHSVFDREAFETICNLDSLDTLVGNNKIIQAYNYFKQHYEDYYLDFKAILTNLNMVDIVIDYDEDEQQIFETINSVGRKLTTGELLKNYIFKDSLIDKYTTIWVPAFEKDEEYINYWESVITAGKTKRSNTESFFHAFLQIKMQEFQYGVKHEDKLNYQKADAVFNNYKHFITHYLKKDDIIPFAKDIASYAKIFKESFEVDYTQSNIPAEASIERINFIIYSFDATTLIPYVLYIRKNTTEKEGNEIFEFLEAYIVRRTICKLSNEDYSDLFNESLIANGINTYDELVEYIDAKVDTNLYMPDDETVREAFHNEKLGNERAKAVLYLLESKLRTKKHSTILSMSKSYDLEHLLPKKWQANWPLPAHTDEKTRDSVLLTLGNMMIISSPLNKSIKNANWETKKSGNEKHNGLKAYASDLVIWNGALDLVEWNEQTIFDRAEWLAARANEEWFNMCSQKRSVSTSRIKYSLNGGEMLPANGFVLALVRDYWQTHRDATFEDIEHIFPAKLQGSYGVIRTLTYIEEKKYNDKYEKNSIFGASGGLFARVRITHESDGKSLTLPLLEEHGLKAPPYTPFTISKDEYNDLREYIEQQFITHGSRIV